MEYTTRSMVFDVRASTMARAGETASSSTMVMNSEDQSTQCDCGLWLFETKHLKADYHCSPPIPYYAIPFVQTFAHFRANRYCLSCKNHFTSSNTPEQSVILEQAIQQRTEGPRVLRSDLSCRLSVQISPSRRIQVANEVALVLRCYHLRR